MRKRIAAICMVLAVVLSFTACEEDLSSAQEIIDGVITAQDEIDSYEFSMGMSMDASGEAVGETFNMTMRMDLSGALDVDNRQMQMDLTMDMAIPGEDEMEVVLEIYLADNIAYVMTEELGQDTVWEKEELSETDWEDMFEVMAMTKPQVELLKTADVKVLHSEKVKGVDCYVLQLTPDKGQLWETAMQQAAFGREGVNLPEIPRGLIDELLQRLSVKQWVAKDTYFLMKAEIGMGMELTPEALGFPEEEGEMSMDITLSYLTYNHNQPISIVLPPEAEESEGTISVPADIVELRTQTYNFTDFNRVEVGYAFQAKLVQSSSYSISITAPKDLFDFIQVSREEETLRIGLTQPIAVTGTRTVEIRMPELRAINLLEATKGTIDGFSSSHNFKIELSSASALDGNLVAGNVDFDVSGASTVELEGSAQNINVDVWGASRAQLVNLSTRNADVTLNGASSATVNLDGRLDADLSGASRLEYVGAPTLGSINLSGGSTLSRK